MAGPPKNFLSNLIGPAAGAAATGGLPFDPVSALGAVSPLFQTAPAFSGSDADTRIDISQNAPFIVGAPASSAERAAREFIPFVLIGGGLWLAARFLRK